MAKKKRVTAADKRASRSKQIFKNLGKEATGVFDDLSGFIERGGKKAATTYEKAFKSMATKLQKDFKVLEEAAAGVGTEGYKSASAHYTKVVETKEAERRALDIKMQNGEISKLAYERQKDVLDLEIESYGVLESKSKQLDKQNELIMAGSEGLNKMKQQYLDMWGTIKAMATSWAGVAGGTVLLNKYLGETSKKLGLSVSHTASLVHQNALLGPAFKMFGLDVASTQKALIDNFQDMNDVTFSNVASMGLLQLQTGLTAEEAGKASRMFSLIEGSTAAAGMSMTKQVSDQAKLAGAIPAKVIADMTANSDKIAEYWAGNVESLTAAAIQASKLGLSMSNISAAAAGLLNVESSIAAEMEAEVLLGRQLNLDKAREAALMGDSETLMKELIKNAGSLEQFNSMNVIQRQKLAAALGIEVSALQKMVQEQDQLSTGSGKMAEYWTKYSHAALTGAPAAIKMLSQLKSLGVGKLWSKLTGIFSGLGKGKGPDVPGIDTKKPDTPDGGGKDKSGMKWIEKMDWKKMMAGAGAMVLVSAALWITAKAMQEFMKVEWSAMAKAGVALLGLVGVLALVGAIMMSGVGAVAILAGAAAMLLFGLALMAVGKGIQMTRDGLTGFATIMAELVPLVPGMLALAYSFGLLGIGLISLSAGLLLLAPMLPIIMALGAMATIAIAMGGGGGAAEGEVMEMKSTSIEDKLDSLTAAILAQPITIEVDGKAVGRGIRLAQTQTTIDMA